MGGVFLWATKISWKFSLDKSDLLKLCAMWIFVCVFETDQYDFKLPPVWYLSISWTNAVLLPIAPREETFMKFKQTPYFGA